MTDHVEHAGRPSSFTSSGPFRVLVVVILVSILGAGVWWWMSQGYERTDDAQVDARVTPIAPRVAGAVLKVLVSDNQLVEPGTPLVELDSRAFEVAVDKARAELADAEAGAIAAQSNVPIAATAATSGVSTAQGSVDQARGLIDAAAREVEVARARLTASRSRLREAEANATRSARDVERLQGLLAKDEVSRQQYDAAVATAEAQKAAVETAQAQIVEGDAAIRLAESRQAQASAGGAQAKAALEGAQTGPEQVTAMRARASAAQARVEQARATLAEMELNLEHTRITAPARGVVSKKSVNVGQVVQVGQPLLAIVQTDEVWVTANFKETQLAEMRPGQRVEIDVDAYNGRTFNGHVDSIAAATGARFSLLPPENATGNYVKVVQRIPVKIVLEAGQDTEHVLRPGMSVTPTVYTK